MLEDNFAWDTGVTPYDWKRLTYHGMTQGLGEIIKSLCSYVGQGQRYLLTGEMTQKTKAEEGNEINE